MNQIEIIVAYLKKALKYWNLFSFILLIISFCWASSSISFLGAILVQLLLFFFFGIKSIFYLETIYLLLHKIYLSCSNYLLTCFFVILAALLILFLFCRLMTCLKSGNWSLMGIRKFCRRSCCSILFGYSPWNNNGEVYISNFNCHHLELIAM